MNTLLRVPAIAIVVALLSACTEKSADQTVSGETAARITETLKARYPGIQIEQVSPSALIPGFYEVITPREIVYTDAKADVAISGSIRDTRTKENLTMRRWTGLRAIDFNALPLDLAIKTVKGDGSRKVALFSDPDCPYCREFEQQLDAIDNVTIYTFLFPLEAVHPDARRKAANIWCAPDRSAAWTQWMHDNVPPPGENCSDEPVARMIALGDKLKVETVPTLFLADGRRIAGMAPAERIEQELRSIATGNKG